MENLITHLESALENLKRIDEIKRQHSSGLLTDREMVQSTYQEYYVLDMAVRKFLFDAFLTGTLGSEVLHSLFYHRSEDPITGIYKGVFDIDMVKCHVDEVNKGAE